MKKIYYCDRFPQEISQHRLAYLLLEQAVLGEYPEISREKMRYERDSFGKPFLINCPEVQFNISHCKTCVACVIGSSRVGIDVERRFPWKTSLARRITHPAEWDWLKQKTGDENFSEAEYDGENIWSARLNLLWSRKESYLKCIGTGIRSDLRKINVLQDLKDDDGNLYFQELQKPDFTLVVCSGEKEEVPVVRIGWEELQ